MDAIELHVIFSSNNIKMCLPLARCPLRMLAYKVVRSVLPKSIFGFATIEQRTNERKLRPTDRRSCLPPSSQWALPPYHAAPNACQRDEGANINQGSDQSAAIEVLPFFRLEGCVIVVIGGGGRNRRTSHLD